MTSWHSDRESCVIAGRTGSGKSTAAREIHAENKRISIWLNEKGVDREPGVSGKRVRSTKGLESGLADGKRKFNWLSSDRESDVQKIREWLWRKSKIAEQRGVETPPFQVIIDEAHRVAPQTNKNDLPSRDAVRRLMREGRSRGVKTMLLSQQIQSLDKQSIRERGYLVAFELSTEQQRYLRDYGVSVDELQELPEYSSIVYKADGNVAARSVKAKSKYG